MPLNVILVRLSISMFNNIRQDMAITNEVKLAKTLGDKAGKWVKYKLPDEALAPIRSHVGSIRDWFAKTTVLWDEGCRILNMDASAKFTAEETKWREGFWKAVDAFGEQYPQWITQARIMHKQTFNEEDYPEWKKMRTLFNLRLERLPFPDVSHFSQEMRRLYGEEFEATATNRINAAVADAMERVIEPVQKMATTLASPDAIFRDSLVDNIREVLQIAPSLNITNDRRLADAITAVQNQIATLNPDTLRDNPTIRKDAADKAAVIVARFGKFGARKLAA